MGKLKQDEFAKRVILLAVETARTHGHSHIGTEHLLLGLVGVTDTLATRILSNLGVTAKDVKSALFSLMDTPSEFQQKLEAREGVVLTTTKHHILGLVTEGETHHFTVQDFYGRISLVSVHVSMLLVPEKPTEKDLVIASAGTFRVPSIRDRV